jgi:hypothetical protein
MNYLKKPFLACLMTLLLASMQNLSGQDTTYYPNGNPDKWTVQLTPFLWMPWINGELESDYLSKSFNVPVTDLLSNLEMAFMIDAEISKDMFFFTPSYMYVKVGAEKVIRTSHIGQMTATAFPELKMNIAELMFGMHVPLNKTWILDPYLGTRFNNFKTTMDIEGIKDTTSIEETSEYWDPVLGIRVQYFPHPRVPISFKADVGGFGVGSRIAATAGLIGGYAISPQIDLLAGFSFYAADFVNDASLGSTRSLSAVFYGFNVGAKIILPKRFRDPSIFKKKKKG